MYGRARENLEEKSVVHVEISLENEPLEYPPKNIPHFLNRPFFYC